MTAIEIVDQKLVPVQRPLPKPGLGEVLVKVHAAGVNRPDLLQRRGLYPPPVGVSDVPGLEIAGVIVGTKKKICALVPGGGYAEYCVVPKVLCMAVPKGFDFIRAAALPETFFTVWRNLFDCGHLKKGESVLIHGGASGIGVAAIQVAKVLGAKVFVTAGSEAKCVACRDLGAALAVNYRAQDFVEEVLKATKGRGVDVVLDMVGGDYIPRNLKVLALHGRHVSIAMMKGRIVPMDIFEVMSKQLVMTGSTLRSQPLKVKAALAKALSKKIWPLLAKKKIQPVIDKVFSLSEAQAAHDYLEAGRHIGKVILRCF
jgi:putative PIG3 family NAD(P)H quinone oxidoreductase